MMKLGKFRGIALVIAMAVVLGMSMGTVPAQAKTTHITIGTASVGGMNYPVGISMATIWNGNIDGVKAVAIASGGSVNNIDMLRTQDIEVAVCRAVEAHRAFKGIEKYKSPMTWVRALTGGVMFDAKQVAARKDAGIDSIADFKGKRIAVGPLGGGGEVDSREILKAYGLTFDDITPEYVDAGQAVDMMADGLIDGAILGLTPGSSAIAELMVSGKVKLLPISDEGFANLKKVNEWVQRRTIPANLYTNQDYDVVTAGDPADLIVCRADLPEELAYQMTKALYENAEVVRSVAAAVSQFGADLVEPSHDMMIPYHPGALKYFKEAGILK